MTFAEALRKAMDERDIRQAQIVKATGMSDAYVSMLVNGKVTDPKFTTAAAVIRAIGMDLDDFAALMKKEG